MESRNKAFSLIELLLVIAVLAVLLIIAIPVVQKANEKTKQVKCLNNLRQLHQVLVAYASDRGGKIPLSEDNTAGAKSNWLGDLRTGGYITDVYVTKEPSLHINFCPASKVRNSGGYAIDYIANYGMNRHIGGSIGPDTPRVPIQKIAEPSKKMLLLDAGYVGMYPSVVNGNKGSNIYIPGITANKNGSWMSSCTSDAVNGRHNGRINLMMVDGHAESWVPDDLISSSYWAP